MPQPELNPLPLRRLRTSLPDEVVASLEEILDRGDWGGYLHAERELCDRIGVCRSTLREALVRLRDQGRLVIRQGQRTRIVQKRPQAVAGKVRKVFLVLSSYADRPILHSGAFWLDEFRQLAAKIGYAVVLENVSDMARGVLQHHLQALRDNYQPSAWVLVGCNERLHQTLHRLGWPVVVGGSTYPGVALPSVDVDYRAVCRHAVGKLARLGHTRLGLVVARSNFPGDLHSIEGFQEGLQMHRGEKIDGFISQVDGEVTSVHAALFREYARSKPATALIVCRSYVAMSVLTVLGTLGQRVPRDVSIIVRDYNHLVLAPVWPPLASYQCPPVLIARKILSVCRGLIDGRRPKTLEKLFVPEFIEGKSLLPGPGSSDRSG